jgi:hypothetical protein
MFIVRVDPVLKGYVTSPPKAASVAQVSGTYQLCCITGFYQTTAINFIGGSSDSALL